MLATAGRACVNLGGTEERDRLPHHDRFIAKHFDVVVFKANFSPGFKGEAFVFGILFIA